MGREGCLKEWEIEKRVMDGWKGWMRELNGEGREEGGNVGHMEWTGKTEGPLRGMESYSSGNFLKKYMHIHERHLNGIIK